MGTSEKLPEISVLHRAKRGVQIMTVHKSKGLEFKVVIFAGLGTNPPPKKENLAFGYGGNIVASENKGIRKILEEDSNDRETAEKKRIMYVAMTRAMDHLIMVGGYSGTTMSDMMSWYVDAIGADLDSGKCQNPDVILEDVTDAVRVRAKSDENPILPKVPEQLHEFRIKDTHISVTQMEKMERPKEKRMEAVVLPGSDVDGIIARYSLQDGFGTLCHNVLEKTMSKGNIDDVPYNLCESDDDNKALLNQAKSYANGFFDSELYRRLINGHKTRQEIRFYTSLGELDVALEGVIDLLVLGDNTNLVVDYKTDSIKDPDSHKAQVLAYVKVAEQIFKRPCLGTLFYLRDSSTGPVWDRDGNCVELPSSL